MKLSILVDGNGTDSVPKFGLNGAANREMANWLLIQI